MNQSSLTKITLEGYKSFRKLELELRPLNVLIGANGVGKSNLVSFFKLLHSVINTNLYRLVAEAGGADIFLRYGKKVTKQILIQIEFGRVYYNVELTPDATDSLLAASEGGTRRLPHVIEIINDIENFVTPSEREDIFDQIQLLINDIRIYHLHDTSNTAAIKGWGALNDNIELRSDGENLSAILYKIRVQNLKAYQTIRDVIRSVAPYFDDFLLRDRKSVV